MHERLISTLQQARRLIGIVVGLTVFGLGVVMIFLPGPGLLVAVGGLGLLAGEFVWARWLLRRVKALARRTGLPV